MIADEEKEDAKECIKGLSKAGIKRIVMLTGDRLSAAKAIADRVGIKEYHADLLPADKVEVHTISVLYCACLCMKCSLGISNFLEEIFSLSYSVVFLYFFALIAEEGFLISSCCSLELHSDAYIFPFLLCLSLLFFSQLFVRSPQTTIFVFFYFSFLGIVLFTTFCMMS